MTDSGIGRMIQACRAHGPGPPEFEEIGTHFRVTIRLEVRTRPEVDELGGQILKAIRGANGRANC